MNQIDCSKFKIRLPKNLLIMGHIYPNDPKQYILQLYKNNIEYMKDLFKDTILGDFVFNKQYPENKSFSKWYDRLSEDWKNHVYCSLKYIVQEKGKKQTGGNYYHKYLGNKIFKFV